MIAADPAFQLRSDDWGRITQAIDQTAANLNEYFVVASRRMDELLRIHFPGVPSIRAVNLEEFLQEAKAEAKAEYRERRNREGWRLLRAHVSAASPRPRRPLDTWAPALRRWDHR